MVEVQISAKAKKEIRALLMFYKDYPGKANQIMKKIREGVNTLAVFPNAGALDGYLSEYSIAYRSLVLDPHYKMIYHIESGSVVRIDSIWDCRQDPLKLFDTLPPHINP